MPIMPPAGWSNRGRPALAKIAEHFGPACCSRRPDRAALRKLIFEVPEERRWLEALLHPLIAEEIATSGAGKIALCDSGFAAADRVRAVRMTQRILVIDVPNSCRSAHPAARPDSEQQVQAILKAQSSREDRLNHADDVVVNDRDLAWLHSEVERLHHFYLTLRGGRHEPTPTVECPTCGAPWNGKRKQTARSVRTVAS
jgi:dephospho-CoA kinase